MFGQGIPISRFTCAQCHVTPRPATAAAAIYGCAWDPEQAGSVILQLFRCRYTSRQRGFQGYARAWARGDKGWIWGMSAEASGEFWWWEGLVGFMVRLCSARFGDVLSKTYWAVWVFCYEMEEVWRQINTCLVHVGYTLANTFGKLDRNTK